MIQPHVVRALISPMEIMFLKEYALYAYQVAERSDDPVVKTALEWGGIGFAQLLAAEPHRFELWTRPVIDAIEAKFPGSQLRPEFSAFRRIERNAERNTYIRWHMDADGAGSWQADPVINVWLPTEEVGPQSDYPSLELIINSEKLMRKVGIAPPGHRPDEWVKANLPNAQLWTPTLKPGDALVFSHYVLHRTQPMDDPKVRIGCEFRFALPKNLSWQARLRQAVARLGELLPR